MTVASDVTTSDATVVAPAPRRRRRPDPLTVVVLLAAAAFVLLGIGSPLLGRTVFAATDELNARSPYLDAGGAGTVVTNTFMDDTYTFQLPATALFVEELRAGRLAGWNPYASGGMPLAATPNYALASPLT